MPILVIATVVALGAWAWSAPHVRDAFKRDPKKAVFWGLLLVALVLASFRTGRHWLGIGAAAALVWGPRLLQAIGLGQQLRGAAGRTGPPRPGEMTRAEALEVLGLEEGATTEQIKDRYRELMKAVHPDRGGSGDLAKRVNRAKTALLGRR